MKITLLSMAIAVSGCAHSIKSRADAAYASSNYLEAERLYAEAAGTDPKAAALRDRARTEAVRELVGATARARNEGRRAEASTTLAEAIQLRDTWASQLDGAVTKQLAEEVERAGSMIAAAVTSTATNRGPLSAELVAAYHAPLLALRDFQAWRRSVEQSVRAAGQARCDALTQRASTPYWSWIVASYCGHFGGREVEMLPRPKTSKDLEVEAAISGISQDDASGIASAIAAAFRDSVWYSPSAPTIAHARLSGTMLATFESRTVSEAATWTVQVPYVANESALESYQEPYDAQESHTDLVLVPGSSGPVYRSVTTSHTVTKFRTALRAVSRPVVRYRDEVRSFTYPATQRAGRYESALRVQFDRDSPPVTAEVFYDVVERGLEHDISNSEAGVSPQRANLPGLADLMAHEKVRLTATVKNKLEAAYREAHCSASKYTLEEAAACAYLGPADAPRAVHAALREVFGDDEPRIAAMLAR